MIVIPLILLVLWYCFVKYWAPKDFRDLVQTIGENQHRQIQEGMKRFGEALSKDSGDKK